MVVQTNSGARQAAVRAITGTTYDYNGDWMALFDLYDIPRYDFNGRFLRWLQITTGSDSTDINDLKQIYAELLGFYNWNSINTLAPSLPNLTAWYDFSNAAYLTLSATAITQALDRSGNGNNTAVQGTGTARPTFTAAQLNGLPCAVFDGGDILMMPSALYALPNGANTAFIVAKRDTEAAVSQVLISIGIANPANYNLFMPGTAGRIEFRSNAAAAGNVISTGNTNTNYQLIQTRRSGTTQALAVNGGTAQTNTNGTDYASSSAASIGATIGGTGFLTGGYAEILIYNRSLEAAEIAAVNRYLASKWGITLV